MREKETERKPIVVLGSTGSVGTQALDVAMRLSFPVDAISANTNVDAVEQQARKFRVRACAMADMRAAEDLRLRLRDLPIKIYAGDEGICEMTTESPAPLVLNSIIGEAGLAPTLASLRAGKQLALSNKESLVVAGALVMKTAKSAGITIRPMDSEHCAIAQALTAGNHSEVKRLLLTASGGPFFGYDRERLAAVCVEDALAHPTWKMGQKITVDSATMMNKGFEIIEASWLFDIPEDRIDVVIHRESIIHSMVEYIDNSVLAQMAVPDMRLCVQHALTAPAREAGCVGGLNFSKLAGLTFYPPDEDTFVPLRLARECLRRGGAMTAVLNAANEVAVAAFLKRKIGFCSIFAVLEETVAALRDAERVDPYDLEDILRCDREARAFADAACRRLNATKCN